MKNLETHQVLFCVLSAVTEASQGLRAAQRKGNKPTSGRSRKASWKSDALPTILRGSEAELSPRKGVL